MNQPRSRRAMLKQTGLAVAAGLALPVWKTVAAESDPRKSRRLYLPSLHDRAKLAINCLTEHCDVARGRMPYFYTRMADRPPTMMLAVWSYGDGLGRSVDALVLLRHLTGDTLDHPADKTMRASLVGLLGVDGLSWVPAEPWTMNEPHTRTEWLQQGTLLALTSLFQVTGDAEYRRLTEQNIRGLLRLARRRPEGHLDFPGSSYTRSDGWAPHGTDPFHRYSTFSVGTTMPLLRFHRLTGFAPALELASGLMDWALRDHDDGKKLFDLGHFHMQSRLMLSVLLRGLVKSDRADLELGEQLYRKACKVGTLSGWFPEQINNPEHNRSNLGEACCLCDMLEAAILLAQHRDPRYWHDAERYVRNHLLAFQLTEADWFAQMTHRPPDQYLLNFRPNTDPATGVVSNERAAKTLLGGFAGWGAVTAMSDDSPFANINQHCCNAAGARAVYDAWRYAVTDEAGTLSVNLHVHRRHAAAEILAEEEIAGDGSGTGRLRIRMFAGRKLRVRVPEFVEPREMRVRVNAGAREATAERGFLNAGDVPAGASVEIEYPLKRRVTTERVAPGEFTFTWRGATIVAASPVQKIRPYFSDARFLSAPPEIGPAVANEVLPL
jgi:hypothetical protein